MPHPFRFLTLMVSGLGALGVAQAASAPNTLTVTVANGPFAGTYQASDVICMRAKKQNVYTAAWKDFNATGPKAFAEAGIEVSSPDAPGAKHGHVRVAFGDPSKKPTVYYVTNASLTLTTAGKGGTIAFDGKTEDNIRIKMTASCQDVETL